jgi:hypothetical protein
LSLRRYTRRGPIVPKFRQETEHDSSAVPRLVVLDRRRRPEFEGHFQPPEHPLLAVIRDRQGQNAPPDAADRQVCAARRSCRLRRRRRAAAPRHGAANARRSRPKGRQRRARARLLRSRSLHARLRALDGRGSAPIQAASRDGVLRRPGIEVTFVAITMPRHPRQGHLLGDRTSERIREREPLSVGRPHSVIGIEATVVTWTASPPDSGLRAAPQLNSSAFPPHRAHP